MNTLLILYVLIGIWWSHYFHVEILHQYCQTWVKATLTIGHFVFWPAGIVWLYGYVVAAAKNGGLYWW